MNDMIKHYISIPPARSKYIQCVPYSIKKFEYGIEYFVDWKLKKYIQINDDSIGNKRERKDE